MHARDNKIRLDGIHVVDSMKHFIEQTQRDIKREMFEKLVQKQKEIEIKKNSSSKMKEEGFLSHTEEDDEDSRL